MRNCRNPLAAALVATALAAPAIAGLPAAEPTLYDRVGGADKVSTIVSRLIDRTSTDPRTARSFAGVTQSRVKGQLTLEFCRVMDGGCVRDGDSMRDVHAGLAITRAEFHALVAILREVLDEERVPIRERNELLARLAPMHRDVVER